MFPFPLRTLLSKVTQEVDLSEEIETIYFCRYSKDVHRNNCQALTIASLTNSTYTTRKARIICYKMLSMLFLKNQDVRHTLSGDIKCQDVQHTISAFINRQLQVQMFPQIYVVLFHKTLMVLTRTLPLVYLRQFISQAK